MKRPRVPREIEELVEALRQHTDLLADYGQRAFGGGDERYLGEVAGKLRLLVYDRGRNRPLLLDLMQAFGLDVQVTLMALRSLRLLRVCTGGTRFRSAAGLI